MQMTGFTVMDAFIHDTGQNQILQTGNGSCYISQEFQIPLSSENIKHHFIYPHYPNDITEIENTALT
jgi:transposase InsO family protein